MNTNYSSIKDHSGKILGKGKRDFMLFNYILEGSRVYITFEKNLSSQLSAEYDQLVFFPSLTRDWHTHIAVQNVIREAIRENFLNERADQFTFGKYNGMKIADVNDRDYWKWLANKSKTEANFPQYDKFHQLAVEKMQEFGFVNVAGRYFDPQEKAYQEMQSILAAVTTHEPFNYISLSSSGSRRFGNLLVRFNDEVAVHYHTYYGVVNGIEIEGVTRKLKNKLVHVFDYIFDENSGVITIYDFSVERM